MTMTRRRSASPPVPDWADAQAALMAPGGLSFNERGCPLRRWLAVADDADVRSRLSDILAPEARRMGPQQGRVRALGYIADARIAAPPSQDPAAWTAALVGVIQAEGSDYWVTGAAFSVLGAVGGLTSASAAALERATRRQDHSPIPLSHGATILAQALMDGRCALDGARPVWLGHRKRMGCSPRPVEARMVSHVLGRPAAERDELLDLGWLAVVARHQRLDGVPPAHLAAAATGANWGSLFGWGDTMGSHTRSAFGHLSDLGSALVRGDAWHRQDLFQRLETWPSAVRATVITATVGQLVDRMGDPGVPDVMARLAGLG